MIKQYKLFEMTKFIREAFLQFLLAQLAAGEVVVDGGHVLLVFFHDQMLSSVEQKQLLPQQFRHTHSESPESPATDVNELYRLVVEVIFPQLFLQCGSISLSRHGTKFTLTKRHHT